MLARFEKLVEQAVEGSLRRVFPTTVQPVQLAKAAARAMEDAQVIGLHGAEVPNKYELQLAPDDLERFGDYASTLCDEVSRYLADYARDRGLRLVAAPRVELQPDADVRAGSVRAQARFVDLAPPARREIDAAVEGTRRLRLADLAEARAASPAVTERGMWLEDRLGLRAPLDPRMGIVRLGRATDNDVVIANQRVSRYHAQLRWVESSWLVYDLDSTNGTWVDGQRVFPSQPRVFGSGAQLRLGDHELRAAAE
jgi:Protein of unknown function (DUF3662)/FHA domain